MKLRSALLTLAVLAQHAAAASCGVSFGNASYDLSALTQSSGDRSYYTVSDLHKVSNGDHYNYSFNVCANLRQYPDPQCYNPSAHAMINGNSYNLSKTHGPAYQWNPQKGCHALGSGRAQDMRWGLYDGNDPAAGVSLTYINGDFCGSESRNRQITLVFTCNDGKAFPPRANQQRPGSEEEVYEDRTPGQACKYIMIIPSIAGCPTECARGTSNDGYTQAVCSGRGVCGYDSVMQKSRCFCSSGYGGSNCGTITTPSPTGVKIEYVTKTDEVEKEKTPTALVVVLVFVCIFLFITIGILGFVCYRIRNWKDPTSYDQLDGHKAGRIIEDDIEMN